MAKLLIFREIDKSDSKEYDAVVDAEDTAVADFATFAGGEYLHISPTAIEIISERYNVMEVENRAVGFISHSVDELKVPYGNIDRVAVNRFAYKTLCLCQRIMHRASGGYMYRASHDYE